MSTVALERQHRWRCRLQDISPHLQPPSIKYQPPKPLCPLLPPQRQSQDPSCFPIYVSSLQNPAAFQSRFFPSTAPPPVFSHPCLSVPQSQPDTQSFNQGYNLAPVPPPSHPDPHPTPGFSPNPGQVIQPNFQQPPPTPPRPSASSQAIRNQSQANTPDLTPSGSQDYLSCSSCCSPKLTLAGLSPSNCNLTACNIHAQTKSDNLDVSAIKNIVITHGKDLMEGFLLRPNQNIQGHCLPSSILTSDTTDSTGQVELKNSNNSKTKSLSADTSNTNSISSIPKSLESCSSSNRPADVRSCMNSTGFTSSTEPKHSCSKSDSDLCREHSPKITGMMAPHSEFFEPREGALNSQAKEGRLTAEEESSSFDSGPDENFVIPQQSPNHKCRKKRHSQQEEKTQDLSYVGENEEVVTSQDEGLNPAIRKGTPYTNSNSRGNIAGKTKGAICCTRRRMMDDEGYIRRAACICVNKEETQVLLISSKKDRCAWLVPGGGLEMGEDPASAATREAWEEAGVLGHIARYLGLFESYHHSGLKKHRTAVYIFVVTEEHNQFPEARLGRRRQWFSLEEALLHLTHHRPLQSAYLQLMMMSSLEVAATS